MNDLLMKLSVMLLDLKKVQSDKGTLIFKNTNNGEEVFMMNEGKFTVAEDGAYLIDENTVNVKDGKVFIEEVEMEDEAPVEEPVNEEPVVEEPVNEEPVETPEETPEVEEVPAEPEVNPLEEELNSIKGQLAERDAVIAELKAKLEEQELLLKAPQAESAHEVAKKAPQAESKLFKSYLK